MSIQTVLQGRGPIRTAIQVVDVGLDTPYGIEPWGQPTKGGPLADRATTTAKSLRMAALPTPGGVYAGGGARDDRDLHHWLSE